MQRNVLPVQCGHAAAAAVQWQLPEYLWRTRQLGNLYGFADTEVHTTVGDPSRCLAHTRLSTDAHWSSSSSGETCSNLRTENTTRAHWFKIFCTRFFWVVPQPPHTVIQYMTWETSFETAQRSVASPHHERHVCFPCEMGIDYDPQYSGFGWRD